MDNDEILIKLKRLYGKDETVAALSKKIKELEFENGKLKSEIQHLEHKVILYEKDENKQARVEARKTEKYQDILKQNKLMKEKFRRFTNFRNQLISRINILEKELNNKS